LSRVPNLLNFRLIRMPIDACTSRSIYLEAAEGLAFSLET
jgi:hypothetical protein